MKKWKCTVCGYIHEGGKPPATCPVCKAEAEKFVQASGVGPERRWKCTVCGYIHEGDKPPMECPVCKAGAGAFVEIDVNGERIASVDQQKAVAQKARAGVLAGLVLKYHLHPIATHSPNGILPPAILFLAISMFLSLPSFELAAFYNLVFVLLTIPAVLLSGYLEWQKRYRGVKTLLFLTKITCAGVVTLLLVVLVGWRVVDPGVTGADSPYRLIYFGLAVLMLAATGVAGHLGGKLVFGHRKQ